MQHRGDLGRAGDQVAAELVDASVEPAGRAGDAEGRDHVAARAAHGYGDAGQPVLELVDGDGVARAGGPARRRARARRAVVRVSGVSRSRRAAGRSSTPQARKTLPSAEVWAGRRPGSSRGCRAGTASRPGRPGRPGRRGSPRGGPSPGCRSPTRSIAGRASRTSSSHGSCRAAYSQNRLPATYAAVVVTLEQPAALEGGEHPRGRGLREPGRLLQLGERQRLVGLHHHGHELDGAVERLGAAAGRLGHRMPPRSLVSLPHFGEGAFVMVP